MGPHGPIRVRKRDVLRTLPVQALDALRPTARGVYLDNDGVKDGRALRHPDARRSLVEEEPHEILLVEPYDALLGTGHTYVRHVGRATRQYSGIGSRDVGVGAYHDLQFAVEVIPHGLFLARR